MSTQKKSIIYLAFLMIFCTILAGCAVYAETAIYEPYMQISSFLSSSNSSEQSNTLDNPEFISNDIDSSRDYPYDVNNSENKDDDKSNNIDEFNNKVKSEKDKSNEKVIKQNGVPVVNNSTNDANSKKIDTSYPAVTIEPSATAAPSPTIEPTVTVSPTIAPTKSPSPTLAPTKAPAPTAVPTIAPTKAPTPTPVSATVSNISLDNLLGKTKSDIISMFGNPVALEKSEYGFYWHVYHKNYSGFIMIGIQNDKVVGLYSNSAALSFENLKVGSSRSSVRTALSGKYTGPLTSIQKGNTRYNLTNLDQKDVFSDAAKYVTVFYDNIANGTLTSIQIISYTTEQSFGYFPAPDSEFAASYERISFYLINSIRVRMNMPVLLYDNNMAKIAAAHSQDMIDRSFFSHTNPDGLNNAARIKAAGYSYFRCAENIAKNHPNAINAHEAYMNSSGHRANILRDVKYVGIGVRMVQGSILQTEVFITYP